MEWKSIEKDGPPPHDLVCYVFNDLAGGWEYKALYYKDGNYFKMVDIKMYHAPALHVTHWFSFPDYPEIR